MTRNIMIGAAVLLTLANLGVARVRSAESVPPESGELLNFKDEASLEGSVRPAQSASVQVEKDGGDLGIKVEYPAGKYPGVSFVPPSGGWDLSSFVGVEAEVANAGSEKVNIGLRVDNKGDWTQEPWSAENKVIGAGATEKIRVIFGRSHGKPGYALDPKQVTGILLFATTPSENGVFVIRDLRAVK